MIRAREGEAKECEGAWRTSSRTEGDRKDWNKAGRQAGRQGMKEGREAYIILHIYLLELKFSNPKISRTPMDDLYAVGLTWNIRKTNYEL